MKSYLGGEKLLVILNTYNEKTCTEKKITVMAIKPCETSPAFRKDSRITRFRKFVARYPTNERDNNIEELEAKKVNDNDKAPEGQHVPERKRKT